MLSCTENSLKTLPELIDHLAALQQLRLAQNKFRGIPDAVSRLPALKVLNMSACRCVLLPSALHSCHACCNFSCRLRAALCSITELPVISDASPLRMTLEEVHMAQNGITDFEDWFSKVRSCCQLAWKPIVVGLWPHAPQMERLSVAHLEMNPMVSPPPHVVLQVCARRAAAAAASAWTPASRSLTRPCTRACPE